MKAIIAFAVAALCFGSSSLSFAAAPELPPGAKAFTTKDAVVDALTTGPRKVTVYDMGKKDFSVQSTYDWPKRVIHNRYRRQEA